MRLVTSSLSLIALLCCSSLGWAEDTQTAPISDPEVPAQSAEAEPAQGLLPLDDLRTFTRVYDHIRTSYVEELSDAELLEYAIKGMMAELDPHSSYLDADRFEDLQVNTSGRIWRPGDRSGYGKWLCEGDFADRRYTGTKSRH